MATDEGPQGQPRHDRQPDADRRESLLDEASARQGVAEAGPILSTRAAERRRSAAVERARARQAANEARVERNNALVRRMKAGADRRAVAAARQATRTRWKPHPIPGAEARAELPSAWQRLQAQFVEGALSLAETEERIARDHDALGARQPDKADECRRVADEARDAARRARALALRFRDSTE